MMNEVFLTNEANKYRIIGNIEKNEFYIVEIVKIDKRDDKTYKNL